MKNIENEFFFLFFFLSLTKSFYFIFRFCRRFRCRFALFFVFFLLCLSPFFQNDRFDRIERCEICSATKAKLSKTEFGDALNFSAKNVCDGKKHSEDTKKILSQI